MNKESERVNYLLQNWSHLQLAREYEKLENIIKEAKNKIENTIINCDGVAEDLIDDVLKILDKGE